MVVAAFIQIPVLFSSKVHARSSRPFASTGIQAYIHLRYTFSPPSPPEDIFLPVSHALEKAHVCMSQAVGARPLGTAGKGAKGESLRKTPNKGGQPWQCMSAELPEERSQLLIKKERERAMLIKESARQIRKPLSSVRLLAFGSGSSSVLCLFGYRTGRMHVINCYTGSYEPMLT